MIENDKRINITKGGQILNKRIEELPREIQLKIKSSNISGYEETSLKKQKRQLKYDPSEGDFFNLVTYDGYFLQGIVIRSHVG